MDSSALAVLIGLLAVVLVGIFLTAWTRDRQRSQDLADRVTRPDPDPSHHDRA